MLKKYRYAWTGVCKWDWLATLSGIMYFFATFSFILFHSISTFISFHDLLIKRRHHHYHYHYQDGSFYHQRRFHLLQHHRDFHRRHYHYFHLVTIDFFSCFLFLPQFPLLFWNQCSQAKTNMADWIGHLRSLPYTDDFTKSRSLICIRISELIGLGSWERNELIIREKRGPVSSNFLMWIWLLRIRSGYIAKRDK